MKLNPLLLIALILQVVQILLHAPFFASLTIVRQIAVFLFLIFAPGIVILELFRFPARNLAEIVLFSVGGSVGFTMFAGLLINELLPFLGIIRPLSAGVLSVSTNVIVFVLWIVGYLRSNRTSAIVMKFPKLSDLLSSLTWIAIPMLTVVGVVAINQDKGNSILLITLLLILILMILSSFSKRLLPPKLYPFAIWTISLALLLHTSLISNSVYGWDNHTEYLVAKETENFMSWDSARYGTLRNAKMNGMLSVTILPATYSILIDIPLTWVMKLIFPFLFSFISVALFLLFASRWSNKIAFVSVFFFVSNYTFFTEMVTLSRQMIAELFYVLLFLMFFVYSERKQMSGLSKTFYFIFYAAALTVSHYAISYIFLIFVLLEFLYTFIFKRKAVQKELRKVVLLFVLMFSWYVFVSRGSAFEGFVEMANRMIVNLTSDFLNPASRGSDVMKGLGLIPAASSMHQIGRYLVGVTIVLILVGFLRSISKRGKLLPDDKFTTLIYLNMAMLGLSFVLPNFATTLRISRLHHILLILLAPLCITGGIFMFEFISRKRIREKFSIILLILTVLVPFFLFQTEFIYEVSNDYSWSIPLSEYRMGVSLYSLGLFKDADVSGAQWLAENIQPGGIIYADDVARSTILFSYGMVNVDETSTSVLTNGTVLSKRGSIYLDGQNTIFGLFLSGRSTYFNISEISPILKTTNRIYVNGISEIYQNQFG